jgi:hypothetical protein
MVMKDGLPAELKSLFGDSSIPPETRRVITNDWNKMTDNEKQQLIDKLAKEKDPLKRILIAVTGAVSNKLKFADVKRIVGEHLKTALNITDFSMTYAKQEGNVWKVNVEYREIVGGLSLSQSALFMIDYMTGEVKQFEKGRFWLG